MYGMPAKEVQRSDQVSDVSQQAENSDLLVNNLSYHQPQALSLAVQRSYSRQYFQRNTYVAGETAVIDFNAGTEFVDPENSYITFTVQLTAPALQLPTAGWGQASAMNVIRQCTIKTRSGIEADRVERCNLWSAYNTAFTNTSAYLSRQGPLEGWRTVPGTNENPLNTVTPVRYVIPLKRLAPFFKPITRGQKIPPQLMSGLRMELIFESAAQALFQGAGSVVTAASPSYTVSSLAIMLDSICMTDDVQRTINNQSSRDGLEYSYPRIFTAVDSVTSSSTNTQVRKAVSQASIAYSIPLLAANQQLITADSFRAMDWATVSLQYRLGALYYPIQEIQDPLADAREGYAQALEMWDKFKHPEVESSISLDDFKGTSPLVGWGIMAVSLEKDTAMDLSGLPVNNSRVLENLSRFSAAAAREVVTFLEYVSVSRSYVDNTQVSL